VGTLIYLLKVLVMPKSLFFIRYNRILMESYICLMMKAMISEGIGG